LSGNDNIYNETLYVASNIRFLTTEISWIVDIYQPRSFRNVCKYALNVIKYLCCCSFFARPMEGCSWLGDSEF